MASPFEISIALHYYVSPSDFRDGDTSAPAVREALFKFEQGGLLERTDSTPRYRKTEALDVYVDALCGVGFPARTWVMPEAKSNYHPPAKSMVMVDRTNSHAWKI